MTGWKVGRLKVESCLLTCARGWYTMICEPGGLVWKDFLFHIHNSIVVVLRAPALNIHQSLSRTARFKDVLRVFGAGVLRLREILG